jgi:hypothetical protein
MQEVGSREVIFVSEGLVNVCQQPHPDRYRRLFLGGQGNRCQSSTHRPGTAGSIGDC